MILRERLVEPQEVGLSPGDICTGQAVRVIRDGDDAGPEGRGFAKLAAGDRILEIVDDG